MKKLIFILTFVVAFFSLKAVSYKDQRGIIRMIYGGDTLIFQFVGDTNQLTGNLKYFDITGALTIDSIRFKNSVEWFSSLLTPSSSLDLSGANEGAILIELNDTVGWVSGLYNVAGKIYAPGLYISASSDTNKIGHTGSQGVNYIYGTGAGGKNVMNAISSNEFMTKDTVRAWVDDYGLYTNGLHVSGNRIDSIYNIGDSLYFATDSGAFGIRPFDILVLHFGDTIDLIATKYDLDTVYLSAKLYKEDSINVVKWNDTATYIATKFDVAGGGEVDTFDTPTVDYVPYFVTPTKIGDSPISIEGIDKVNVYDSLNVFGNLNVSGNTSLNNSAIMMGDFTINPNYMTFYDMTLGDTAYNLTWQGIKLDNALGLFGFIKTNSSDFIVTINDDGLSIDGKANIQSELIVRNGVDSIFRVNQYSTKIFNPFYANTTIINDSSDIKTAMTTWYRNDTIDTQITDAWIDFKFDTNIVNLSTYGFSTLDSINFICSTYGIFEFNSVINAVWRSAISTQEIWIRVLVNGSEIDECKAHDLRDMKVSDTWQMNVNGRLVLTPGDYFKIQYYISSTNIDFELPFTVYNNKYTILMNCKKISK
jgi:hypothetical protein